MFRSLEVAATGMSAQETKLDTISNNLANANTVGFKRQDAEFEDLLYQRVRAPAQANGVPGPVGVEVGAGARVVATNRLFSQGSVTQTGNPLDLAIQGNGFFGVQSLSGEIQYTRCGSLKLNAQGQITTSDGLAIQPPITVPQDATGVTIGADGTVSATRPNQPAPTALGQLQLAAFANPAGLAALGSNLFQQTDSSGTPVTGAPGSNGLGSIMQGATESSNVDVVTEMVGLIRAQRNYELNSKVISAADDMLQKATQISR